MITNNAENEMVRLNVSPDAITFDEEGRVVVADKDFADLTRQALAQVAEGQVGPMGISIPIVDVICDNKNNNCKC